MLLILVSLEPRGPADTREEHMAQIVLGLGTSHSPQLSTPADKWPLRAELDKRRDHLFAPPDGRRVTYEELLAQADAAIARELTPEKFRTRYDANQRGIARVGEALAKAAPDVLIMIGDDQKELFHEDNMPALSVYWGETILNRPRYAAESGSEAARVAAWAYGEEERRYPVASDLGHHLIESLIDRDFDVAHCRYLREGQGVGHAFGFVYRRIMEQKPIPTIPIMLNTYFPPNQPTPKRCYELGRAIRAAVESWPKQGRVAVIASGGLSHFVVDEELDRRVLKAMEEKDVAGLSSLPRERMNAGTSETRNWIVAAGAAEELDMELFDYVPCYRSPAGTGCAMAFARWA
jgi:3-O-methylgallate 3,4-dioxygenase